MSKILKSYLSLYNPDIIYKCAIVWLLFISGEAKNLPARNNGAACHRDIYCVLSLDQEEIFRTSTMERTLKWVL